MSTRAGWSFELQRFAGERTLPATPRRRQRAREQGQIAHSSDLSAAVGFLAAAAALAVRGPASFGSLAGWAQSFWGQAPSGDLDVQGVMALCAAGARVLVLTAGPILVAAAGAAAAVGAAQTGFAFSLQPLMPSFARLNPVEGLTRLFSRRALVELAKALLKVGAIALLVYGPSRGLLEQIVSGGLGAPAAASLAFAACRTVLLRAGVVLLAAGAADFFYQRSETDTALRMSREEARQELRESEGDPALRLRRRRRARELTRRRMLTEVRRADVVVANPTHVAVALRYDSARMASPQVVAKGVDLMAERIKAVARAAGVLIVENAPLARSLNSAVKVGQYIPASLYKAVAEVLAFVWRVRGRGASG